MVPYEEYEDRLRQCSICLSLRNPDWPENHNNFPSKIIQYMAAGKRIVSTMRYPALSENILYYCDYTQDIIAKTIRQASIKNQEQYKLLLREYEQVLEQNYSSKAMEEYMELLEANTKSH
jgi:hypothetical protein